MPITFPLTLSLYAVSLALYLAHAATAAEAGGQGRLARAARLILASAFVFHAVDIGLSCVRGVNPFSNPHEVLSFIAWLNVGAYLLATLRHDLALVGAMVVPVAMVLDIAARLSPSTEPGGQAMTGLGTVHIALATAGVSAFAVAAAAGAAYLVAESQLKHRHFGALFKKGPPLATLDALNRRCILLGFPLFTVAMVTGAIWVSRLPGGGAHSLLRPQYLLSSLAWLLYAGLLSARLLLGWRGRRAALLTLAGFALALCVLAIYLLRSPLVAQPGGVG